MIALKERLPYLFVNAEHIASPSPLLTGTPGSERLKAHVYAVNYIMEHKIVSGWGVPVEVSSCLCSVAVVACV